MYMNRPLHIKKKDLDYTTILKVKQTKKGIFLTVELYIHYTFIFKLKYNNLHFVLANRKGLPYFHMSAGTLKYRNSQKRTPLATRVLSLRMSELISTLGISMMHFKLLGYGKRLRIFLRELHNILVPLRRKIYLHIIYIIWIETLVMLPLNGCRAQRRVL